MGRVFMSYSAVDKPLTNALVDLFESGMGVQHDDIFYALSKTQGVPTGSNFTTYIRRRLKDAEAVVAVISEKYYASLFCMSELGAAWILAKKKFIPILVPPLDFDSLKSVLEGTQVLKLDDAEDLDQLFDDIKAVLEITGHGTPRWTTKRDAFLKELKRTLSMIETKGPVPREKYEVLRKKLRTRKRKMEALEKEVERLTSLNFDLMRVKDAASAAKVVRKHSKDTAVFVSLVENANDALRTLPPFVRKALFHDARGDQRIPVGEDEWDDVREADERGYLEESDEGPSVNYSDAKIRKASQAVNELKAWLRSAPEEFAVWYAAEYEEEEPDIRRRQFWEEHLGLR